MNQNSKDQLAEILERVAASLDIPDSLHEEAVSKYEELAHWLEERDRENGRNEPKIYPQGSFELGTVTKPIDEDGECDIDLVYERDLRKTSISQEELKKEAGEHLKSFIEYLKKSHRDSPDLEAGRRCWTLNYPDQFHMDLLPAIPDDEGRIQVKERSETKILITDVTVREWKHSNPKGYADWFREQMKEEFIEKRAAFARAELLAEGKAFNEGMVKEAAEEVPRYKVKTSLQRAVQILKRHRDFYFQDDEENRPATIIINTLAAKSYSREDNLVDALLSIVRTMPDHIERRLENGRLVSWVPNPTNEENENFADRWQDDDHPNRESKFRDWLEKVERDFESALRGGGLHKILKILGGALGETVVKEATAALGHSLKEESSAGALGMVGGIGAIVRTASAEGTTTPIRSHTFYGDEKNTPKS